MIDLDLRAIASWQRHPKILAAFDSLGDADELRITSDFEPRGHATLPGTRRGALYELEFDVRTL